MDLVQRRGLLKTDPNPNKNVDYLITLKAASPDGSIQIELRYIPDRVILRTSSFSNYISGLFEDTNQTLEHYSLTLCEDIHDELITRWINTNLDQRMKDGTEHCVNIEDRQPQWDNPQLLNRLKMI